MKIAQWFRTRFGRDYISAKTGGKTKRCGFIQFEGQKVFITMPLNKNGGVDYALEDIEGMTIKCAWCARPIFVGDAVTLYATGNPNFQKPDHAVVYSLSPLTFVGCLRRDCAETGADRSGFWLPDDDNPGKAHVHRVPDVIQLLLANPHAECIIINNTRDPSAKPIIK